MSPNPTQIYWTAPTCSRSREATWYKFLLFLFILWLFRLFWLSLLLRRYDVKRYTYEIFYGTTMNFFAPQKSGAECGGKQKGAFLELFHSELSCFVEIGDNLVKLIPLFRSLTARWYKRKASAMTFFPFYYVVKVALLIYGAQCMAMVLFIWPMLLQYKHLCIHSHTRAHPPIYTFSRPSYGTNGLLYSVKSFGSFFGLFIFRFFVHFKQVSVKMIFPYLLPINTPIRKIMGDWESSSGKFCSKIDNKWIKWVID